MRTERGEGGWFVYEAQDTIYLLKYYKYVDEFYIPFRGNV
jgi:hypothetical protein